MEKRHENDCENGGNSNVDLCVCGFVVARLGEKGGVSLSVNKAEAQQRVYITRGYASRAAYVEPGSWYAVRAYYFGGPWSGAGYSYTGWDDYATRHGIGCTPGTSIKGGDGIMYLCQ